MDSIITNINRKQFILFGTTVWNW